MLNFKEYEKINKECLDLARKKNKIYGCENLKLLNGLSILVRMNDKISRLNKLCLDKIKSDINDETIEDTLKDLCNYSIYYLMYLRGALEDDQNIKV